MKFYKIVGSSSLNIVIWMMFLWLCPPYMTENLGWSMGRQFLMVAFMTIGLSVSMISGVLDLSFVAEIAASTCIGAYFLSLQISVFLTLLVMILFHLAVGTAKGWMIAKLHVSPIIITLALQIILNNLFGMFTAEKLVHFEGITLYSNPKFWMGMGLLLGIFSLLLSFLMQKTYYGKYMRMLGENAKIVRESGLNETGIRMVLSVISSIFYGAAAIVIMFMTSGGSSSNAGKYLFPVIAAACMGGISFLNGRGRLLGSFIGTISIIMFQHMIMLSGIQNSLETILIGLLIIISIILTSIFQKN